MNPSDTSMLGQRHCVCIGVCRSSVKSAASSSPLATWQVPGNAAPDRLHAGFFSRTKLISLPIPRQPTAHPPGRFSTNVSEGVAGSRFWPGGIATQYKPVLVPRFFVKAYRRACAFAKMRGECAKDSLAPGGGIKVAQGASCLAGHQCAQMTGAARRRDIGGGGHQAVEGEQFAAQAVSAPEGGVVDDDRGCAGHAGSG